MPRGGPDGGNGGDGGSVCIVGDSGLNTLGHLRNGQHVPGDRGQHGKGKSKYGRRGRDRELAVPLGTVVWKIRSGEKEWAGEVKDQADRVLVAKGGRGGRGNQSFASSTNRAPVLAEQGEPGEEQTVLLELRLLADVGIVGLPNAGKSTLLSVISRTAPKIADYPFTTKEPQLGVVERGWKTFVAVEVPGIVEGAHMGSGLGLEFLRHARRTRLLVHLVDGAAEDPVGDTQVVNRELSLYEESLAERPQLLIVNKIDRAEVRQRIPDLRRALAGMGTSLYFISAATGEGVEELVTRVQELLAELPLEPPGAQEAVPVLRPKARGGRGTVAKEGGLFVVSSARAERLVGVADLRRFQARLQLRQELARLGVVKALEEAGVKQGDRVRIGAVEIRWE